MIILVIPEWITMIIPGDLKIATESGESIFAVKNNYGENNILRRKSVNTLKKINKHTNKIHHFDLEMSYATHFMIKSFTKQDVNMQHQKVFLYFLLKPSLSDVHQVFICSYAVTTLWVKVATVQGVLMFRLLLNITVAS